MRLGRHREAHGVYFANQRAPVSCAFDSSFRRNRARSFLVEVANERKLGQTLGGEVCVDACVLPAKMAHADDCGA
jgi:hypothetical protein